MKFYLVKGYWWVGYAAPNGRLYLLRKVGAAGDRITP